jgi:hypothetical protein
MGTSFDTVRGALQNVGLQGAVSAGVLELEE